MAVSFLFCCLSYPPMLPETPTLIGPVNSGLVRQDFCFRPTTGESGATSSPIRCVQEGRTGALEADLLIDLLIERQLRLPLIMELGARLRSRSGSVLREMEVQVPRPCPSLPPEVMGELSPLPTWQRVCLWPTGGYLSPERFHNPS